MRNLAETIYLSFCVTQKAIGAPAPIWDGHEDQWIEVAESAYAAFIVLGGGKLQVITEP